MHYSEEVALKLYIRWLDRCIIHLKEYYDAEISYPFDPEEIADEEDGLIFNFNKVDFEMFISNKTMHDLWHLDEADKNARRRKPYWTVHKYILFLAEDFLLKK